VSYALSYELAPFAQIKNQPLTARQKREIFDLIVAGRSNKEIARVICDSDAGDKGRGDAVEWRQRANSTSSSNEPDVCHLDGQTPRQSASETIEWGEDCLQ
jgi:hypothetical protein